MTKTQPPLVSAAWVQEHLEDPGVRIMEIEQVKDGEVYRGGHLPGAVGRYWKELCWDETDREFVTPQQLAPRLGAAGVGPETTLVLYGDPVQYGCYAFWALIMAGHANLRLLDGARKQWQHDNRPMTTAVPTPESVGYEPASGDTTMRVGRDNVLAHLNEPQRLLLDMRSPEEYSGERVMEFGNGNFDHGAERGGRIPGAKHLFFRELLDADDTFKSPAELQAVFDSAGAVRDSNLEIVCYCRLSHRASLAWFALKFILGYENVRIYDGSWTEWGSIVGFPVEK